jgi:hypothetical protein
MALTKTIDKTIQSNFEEAIDQGDQQKVKELISYTNLKIEHMEFVFAVEDQNSEILELLLTHSTIDPSKNNNQLLSIAINNNDYKCVKLLFNDKRINPAKDDCKLVTLAAQLGHINILKLLLSDPRTYAYEFKSAAIRTAYDKKHYKVVKLLWNDINVKKYLKKDDKNLYQLLINLSTRKKINNF